MAGSELPFADRFTGCLLGMAIGDAVGTGRAHRPPMMDELQERRPVYLKRPADAWSGEIPAGQFSLSTELALCLLETIVTSDGFVDPEFAAYRFENAIEKTSYLEDPRERQAILYASEHEEFQSGGDSQSTGYAGPAVRAIPVAMAHSLSDLNVALLTREVLRASLITDGNPEVVNGTLAVAHAVRLILRQELPIQMLVDEILSLIDEDAVAQQLRLGMPMPEPLGTSDVVATALHAFVLGGGDFEQTLFDTVDKGGEAHLTGAIAGALCGAYSGASAIPQDLIDGLEGRAYVLMAAPALLRTAQLRAGLVFQLHLR